jgi:protein-disulfide isomerase
VSSLVLRLLLTLGCAALALWPWRPGSAAEFTPAQRQAIESIVRDYLTNHPEALVGALQAAKAKLDRDADAKTAALIADHRQQIYNDPQTPVGGNLHGNVSLVEFFDYRCPYCKQTQPALEKLLARDPRLRLVYKELPILGQVSVTAAHAALAAERQGKYEAFHRAMMAARGNITEATVLQVARSVGLDLDRLERDMAAPEIDKAIAANVKLADALDINGTPAFVIGDRMIPGAVDLAGLQQLVADPGKK